MNSGAAGHVAHTASARPPKSPRPPSCKGSSKPPAPLSDKPRMDAENGFIKMVNPSPRWRQAVWCSAFSRARSASGTRFTIRAAPA
jgi:hypothetical protein